jgi:HEAT repeat protein
MTSRDFLYVVAIAQGFMLGALVVLVVLNRWFRVRARARLDPQRQALDLAMQRWALGQGSLAEVSAGLARLPVPVAVDALVAWASRVPGERWSELAQALTRVRWAQLERANARSARWWKRLECARFLSVAATPADTARLLRLLDDPHPAVHIAAVGVLERMDSPPLIAATLRRIPRLPATVLAYYAGMLRRSRGTVVALLLEHLSRAREGGAGLARLTEFAARLKDPALRAPLTALADARDPEVRTQVARALGLYPHPDSLAALRVLAADPSWPVRAQAARALGMVEDLGAVPLLRDLLRDQEWWVRLRAGLALMRLGAGGRNRLLEAETGPHPGARAVAGLVLGLSPQAVAEFAT